MTHYTTRRDTAVQATLARIDEVTALRCVECDAPLHDGYPSDWWCSETCYGLWQARHAEPGTVPDTSDPAEVIGTWVDETHRFHHVQPERVIETTTVYDTADQRVSALDPSGATYRRPGSDPVSTVDAAWSPPDTAEAAQRLLADSGADLTDWQRDILRAIYRGDGSYHRVYLPPARRHSLVQLFRRLTGRTQ